MSSQGNREIAKVKWNGKRGKVKQSNEGRKRKLGGQMCGRMAEIEPRGLAAPNHEGWMDASGKLQFLAAIFFHIKKN